VSLVRSRTGCYLLRRTRGRKIDSARASIAHED